MRAEVNRIGERNVTIYRYLRLRHEKIEEITEIFIGKKFLLNAIK